jgi:hypothetical protein
MTTAKGCERNPLRPNFKYQLSSYLKRLRKTTKPLSKLPVSGSSLKGI